VGAILLADLLERLLALQGIQPAGEYVALAAAVAVPQFGGGVVIDHAGDVDRERVERLDRMPRRPIILARVPGFRRGADEQIAQPAAAAVAVGNGRAERRRLRAPPGLWIDGRDVRLRQRRGDIGTRRRPARRTARLRRQAFPASAPPRPARL